MSKQNIIWKDLPTRYNLFTKRSTTMINLDNGKIVRHYAANVKINMVQQTIFNGERFFRTASAKSNGLNLAIRASSFTLPSDDAPLEPSGFSTLNSFTTTKQPRRPSSKQKAVQKVEKPKSGEASHTKAKKVGRLKRFWNRLKG